MRIYTYKTVDTYLYDSVEQGANMRAERGWRVVGVVPAKVSGCADSLLLERPEEMTSSE